MDADLKTYLDAKFKEVNDTSVKNHELTRREMGALRRAVWVLWKKVFGSDPPPPGPGEDPSHSLQLKPEDEALLQRHPKRLDKPLEHKISSHDMDIAGLHGTVLAVDGKVDKLETGLLSMQEELKKQSKEMALGRKGKDYLFSKQGMKDVATLMAGFTGLVTAVGTSFALLTGRLPMPNTPTPPQAQTVTPQKVEPPPVRNLREVTVEGSVSDAGVR